MFSFASNPAGALHERLISNQRVRILAKWFAQLAPPGARILDVGCGDGLLSAAICQARPDLDIQGIEVHIREHMHIPVKVFDGSVIPFDDRSFDAILFSDVLHHTNDPHVLLKEAYRAASRCVLIKDHYLKGLGAGYRLRFMDWVGNARFGVALPYNYWTENEWEKTWHEIGFRPEELVTELGLYPAPANWLFGADLHFISRLKKL